MSKTKTPLLSAHASGKIGRKVVFFRRGGVDIARSFVPWPYYAPLIWEYPMPVPPHHTTHEDGGSDQITVEQLLGLLSDLQRPDTAALGWWTTYDATHWFFGLGYGAKLLDRSGFRAHGDIVTCTWNEGTHGLCLQFNSANPDRVVIPAGYTHLNFTVGDFSIITRIRLDDLSTSPNLFCRGLHNADGYRLWISAPGALYLSTMQAAATQQSRSDDGEVLLHRWYTLGVTRDGAVGKVYKNGADITTTSGAHIPPAACARDAKIGIYDDEAGSPFDGRMEAMIVFGVALTDEEMLAWHNLLK